MVSIDDLECAVEPNSRVLIVDDNPSIHEDFIGILGGGEGRGDLDALHSELFGESSSTQEAGFELDSAYQGEEAIERVRRARRDGRGYALAFVDVRMPPGIDGVETAARLLEEDPELGIVVCSAYSDHSWEEMAERLGRTDRVLILKKPFDTVEVRQLAHALQRRWELARIVELRLGDLTALIEDKTRELALANEQLMREAAGRENALRQLAESNEQIKALAYKDGLTGLPNRRLFNEHLEKVMARARRKSTAFAVLFVDLDNFKLVNDTVGHQAADGLLREMSHALSDLIRSEDMLGLCLDEDVDLGATLTAEPVTDAVLSRVGGDEFVILLPEIRDRFAAGAVAQRILKRLDRPFLLRDQEVFVNASIGIATYPEDGASCETLIGNADTAMYHAKEQGKAAYQYYSEEMNTASTARLKVESGLRRALDFGALELHYQPEVDIASGRIIGAEALLRWRHPERGYVAADVFVGVAEDSGLIVQIGDWALQEACRQAVAWQQAGLPALPVAVNVSGVQFRRQNLCESVERALGESGLPPHLLGVEITETAVVPVLDKAVAMLERLKGLGVRIALDDFGTGYSSLNHLKLFPIDTLKIDKAFTAELLTDERTASITKAIISMTHVLGLRVVAEGVEQRGQLDLLTRLECDAAQGHLFSRPLPPAEFAALFPVPADGSARQHAG